MKKELKDYLHLYLGCKINTSINGTVMDGKWYDRIMNNECDGLPILRPLSDMSEEEKTNIEGTDWTNMVNGGWEYSPETFLFLLSKHFDLFELIESGLAVNAAELQTVNE